MLSETKRQKIKLMKDFKEAMEYDELFDLPMTSDGKIGERWGPSGAEFFRYSIVARGRGERVFSVIVGLCLFEDSQVVGRLFQQEHRPLFEDRFKLTVHFIAPPVGVDVLELETLDRALGVEAS